MSWKNLSRRKLRTGLTVSGIVVGIAMTFVFLSLVSGMDVQAAQLIQRLGGADITIYNATRLGREQIIAGAINTLDASLLTTVQEVDGVYVTSPQLTFVGSINRTRAFINGIDATSYEIVTGGLNVIEGTALVEGAQDAVVLGKTIADALEVHVGSHVTLNDLSTFEVIGIYETGNALQDRGGYVTLAEAQDLSMQPGAITSILVKVTDPNEVDTVQTALTSLLSGIRLVVPTVVLQQVSTVLNTIRLFLFSIGLVALMAGSFGVINTMMTSISERTREIGTLKAIGAKDGQILAIFVSEALLLGVIGGVTGVGAGVLLTVALPLLTGRLAGVSLPGLGSGVGRLLASVPITPALLPLNVLLCFSLGLVVGVIAGLYPSWRAARLHPVEALRHV
jgi:putative ABC transport system permease protein